MKKLFLTLILITLFGCQPQPASPILYQGVSTESGFDTKIRYFSYANNQSEFDQEFKLVKDEFYRLHQMFDKYNLYENINNLKTINDSAGIEPVHVEKELLDLIIMSKAYYDLTDGYFDITLGPVLSIWHDFRDKGMEDNQANIPGAIPSMEELEAAQAFTGWEFVEIDPVKSTVYLNDKNASLDVGGIAKGHAAELVAQLMESNGIEHAIVDGGGNVRTIGNKIDGTPWVIGIQIPSLKPENANIDTFSFQDSMSIVTSGNYQRYYQDKDGNVLSHIINPKTLWPDSSFASVSIFTKDSTLADVLSTTLYTMDFETGFTWFEKFTKENPEIDLDIMWISDQSQKDWKSKDGFYYYMNDHLIQYSKHYKK